MNQQASSKTIMHILTIISVLIIGQTYLLIFPNFIFDMGEKPFVYRQLVPILAWGVKYFFQTSHDASVKIVLLGFFLLMGEALRYFYTSFHRDDLYTEIYILLTSVLVILLATYPPHTYDIPTVALFTLSFSFLKRGKLDAFMLLFPIVCLNRETSLLLIPCMAIYLYGKISDRSIIVLSSICGVIYLGMRALLVWYYQGYPGRAMYNHILENANMIAKFPYLMIVSIFLILAILAMLSAKWEYTPYLLKVVVWVFMPILIVMCFVIGYVIEIRVFLEVLPTLVIIGFWHAH